MYATTPTATPVSKLTAQNIGDAPVFTKDAGCTGRPCFATETTPALDSSMTVLPALAAAGAGIGGAAARAAATGGCGTSGAIGAVCDASAIIVFCPGDAVA